MNETTRKRRLFRISLRSLLIVITVFSIWLGWQLKQAGCQREPCG